ncbi:MAG TPA: retropepsin-like aspartic protease [Bacteroidia bacterium]|nr:retropepsin-like aspartic protease [Bacteroidia bacterium]
MKKKKKIIIPLKILKIENDGLHLLMKVTINNKIAKLIVDTGASRTVLDKNRIHRFVKESNFEKHEALSTGLGTSGMESHIVELKKLKIGNWKFENITWVMLDMSHVNNSYSQIGLKEIDGVLGGDILMKYNAVIDYEKKQMILKLN